MYADKHLEKPTALSAGTPTAMLPTPIAEMHAHAHTHALAHPHLHTLHAQHMQHMQMQQHLQQQQQQQQQPQTHVSQQHVAQHLVQHPHQQSQSTLAVLQQQQHHQQQHPHQQQQQHAHQQHVNIQQQQQQQQQQQTQAQQQQSAMFTRFDANKSTKGASKLRRDLINAEIANLRDLLPLPQSTRQRLSQLQLMALVCVYVRKANYFQQVFKRHDISIHHAPTPNIGFSKALSGFLMMLTQNGKLLYISDNAAEYLGHSMEDLLIHGDSVYDIIDKQDHATIQAELNRNVPPQPGHSQHASAASAAAAAAAAINSLEGEHRMFLCRMNVSRNARRQMRFGDQKVVLVQGHYLSYLPLCSRNEPVFLATCTPIAMPETRECVVQGATNVFTTIHSMDMKIAHIDKNGEFHLGYSKSDIHGLSWYNLLHSENLREAQSKHRLITQSEQDRSCILLVRMQRRQGDFIWVHVVLQVRDSQDTNQQPVIVCTNQVLNEREASVMLANSWLYHYYSVQSKIQFGLAFDAPTRVPPTTPAAAAAAAVYYHHHAHHAAHSHLHHHHTGAASTTATLPATATAGYAAALHPHQTHTHLHHTQHQHLHPHTHTHAHHQYHHMTTASYAGAYNTPTGATSGGSMSVGSGSCGSAESSPAPHLSGHHQQGQQLQHHLPSNGGMAMTGHAGVINGAAVGQYICHRRVGAEPVDYSQVPGGVGAPPIGLNGARSPTNGQVDGQMRCSSTNSSVSSHNAATPHYVTHNNNTSGNNKHNNGSSANHSSSNNNHNSTHNHNLNSAANINTNGNASSAQHQRLSSPPSKRRAIGKLEPLYLPDEANDDTPTTVTEIDTPYHLHAHSLIGAPAESHASVIFATVVPTCPRLIQKSLPNEPPDFIDQWNPSPPWSESAQKLSLDSSSSTQQELSPCITTTPPTPTSAPPTGTLGSNYGSLQTLGPAFSFEWMSDPLVPVADPYTSCITPPDGVPLVVAHHPHATAAAQHSFHWNTTPSEHHQHLSQHLASHGHRLLTLSSTGAVDTIQQSSTVITSGDARNARTKSPEVTERKESPRK
ncbi:protein single-minded [Bactrocera dorsalis]|uniref:Protein single-minded n=1 Tax=Bactrocera dorsalis TaxID=27457 RepID=A0ABM3J6I1_BACDO|nr:protein single-minded [Bactrocera dorsalis]